MVLATFRVGLSQLNLSENALRAKVQDVPDTCMILNPAKWKIKLLITPGT